ncbi:hypothetical protein SAMN05880573_102281 [Chryseobacterium sp. RU33C]|nr:hypothetical protein SAMN05880573_102281 [Chryseobacterium sp. RU33C]
MPARMAIRVYNRILKIFCLSIRYILISIEKVRLISLSLTFSLIILSISHFIAGILLPGRKLNFNHDFFAVLAIMVGLSANAQEKQQAKSSPVSFGVKTGFNGSTLTRGDGYEYDNNESGFSRLSVCEYSCF